MALSSAAQAIKNRSKNLGKVTVVKDSYGNVKSLKATPTVQTKSQTISVKSAPSSSSSAGSSSLKVTKTPIAASSSAGSSVPIVLPAATSKSGIFNNSFFSWAGQAERFANVGATLNAAFNPFSQDRVVANVQNKTLKAALETGANHPYILAGVAATGITAARYAPQIVGSVRNTALLKTAAQTAPKGIASGLKTVGLVGGGVLLGSLLGGGKASNAPQDLSQVQQPTINTTPEQTSAQDNKQQSAQDLGQSTYYTIQDSPGASIQGNPLQTAAQDPYQAPFQMPYQYTPSQIIPSQNATQEQAASSGGMNWGLIAAAAAVVLLAK